MVQKEIKKYNENNKNYKDLIKESQENKISEKKESYKLIKADKIEGQSLSVETIDEAKGSEGIGIGASITTKKIKRQKEIENILSKDMSEVYLKMPPALQEEFKKTGEETAKKINIILDQVKFKVRKIIDLIKRWLTLIPGINKYFLEREAKIKADEIIKIKQEIDHS